MAHSPENANGVLLEGHARTPAGTESATPQILTDVRGGHLDTRGESFDDGHEGLTVGFP